MNELYRDIEVAGVGKWSRRYVHTLNATGRIPKPIHVGRCLRWRASDIAKWFELGCPSRDVFEAALAGGKAGAR